MRRPKLAPVSREAEIRALIVARGYRSIRDFSHAVCVSRPTILKAILGHGPICHRSALSIASGLGLGIDDLAAMGVQILWPVHMQRGDS
jgi:hypothetical protein